MANYTKSTDFASKDALLSGDPNKVVKGSELDDEFDNIQTAVNSKADANSATLTGVPTTPTASYGTSTTQIASTAFVQAALAAVYPIGSVYVNAVNNTNPGTLLGFGTWSAFGAGRVMVGYNASNPLFDAAEETGGSADAVVVSHTHTFSGTTATDGAHTHTLGTSSGSNDASGVGPSPQPGSSYSTNSAGTHSHTFSGTTDSSGSSGTNANYQPYITVYMWKRTA